MSNEGFLLQLCMDISLVYIIKEATRSSRIRFSYLLKYDV